MPFKWEPDRNPYLDNYFGRLRVGPNTPRPQIVAQAKKLKQKLRSGGEVKLNSEALDEHAISDAAERLQNSRALAEELLLVHPQPQRDNRKARRQVVEELRKAAVPPQPTFPPRLRDSLALFWFLPPPGPEIVPPPPFELLELVGPFDEEDKIMDVVFDA